MTKKHFGTLLGGSAIWLAMSGIAVADVTAAEVWDSWKSYSESIGQNVTVGSESNSGGTLTLNEVNIAMEVPDGKISGTLERLELRERGDGTVAITMSPVYPMSISVNPPDGDEVDLTLLVRQDGMELIASGSRDALTYDFRAAEVSVDVDKMFVGGQDFAPKINIKMNDLGGKYAMTEGDLRQVTSAATAATLQVDVDFKDPESGSTVVVSGTVKDLVSDSMATLPKEMDMEDPAWVFGGDFGATGTFASGASDYTMTINNGTDTFTSAGSSATSALRFSMLDGVIAYGGGSTETKMQLSGSQIPFPQLALGMEETAFDLKMPVSQTEEPTSFGLITKLIGLDAGEEIWSMFDPGQVLPHDPATLIIDVSGKLKWLLDISDAEAVAAAGDAPPAEIHALSVNDITLAVAGASVQGTGDFTFDPSDTVTFDGIPAPTGEANFTIVGANGLIDRLIQMGLLPEDQAMGARMMLGMFARPADGEDTLTSKIEVKGDGSVFANGMQLQ